MTAAPLLAVDTSVAVPLVMRRHPRHAPTRLWAAGRALAISGHALAETYSVLTRLPDDLRVRPTDAALLLEQTFVEPLVLSASSARGLPHAMAAANVFGGAVYDAMVGLAALEAGLVLATRDARALGTYRALGVAVEVLTD